MKFRITPGVQNALQGKSDFMNKIEAKDLILPPSSPNRPWILPWWTKRRASRTQLVYFIYLHKCDFNNNHNNNNNNNDYNNNNNKKGMIFSILLVFCSLCFCSLLEFMEG